MYNYKTPKQLKVKFMSHSQSPQLLVQHTASTKTDADVKEVKEVKDAKSQHMQLYQLDLPEDVQTILTQMGQGQVGAMDNIPIPDMFAFNLDDTGGSLIVCPKQQIAHILRGYQLLGYANNKIYAISTPLRNSQLVAIDDFSIKNDKLIPHFKIKKEIPKGGYYCPPNGNFFLALALKNLQGTKHTYDIVIETQKIVIKKSLITDAEIYNLQFSDSATAFFWANRKLYRMSIDAANLEHNEEKGFKCEIITESVPSHFIIANNTILWKGSSNDIFSLPCNASLESKPQKFGDFKNSGYRNLAFDPLGFMVASIGQGQSIRSVYDLSGKELYQYKIYSSTNRVSWNPYANVMHFNKATENLVIDYTQLEASKWLTENQILPYTLANLICEYVTPLGLKKALSKNSIFREKGSESQGSDPFRAMVRL